MGVLVYIMYATCVRVTKSLNVVLLKKRLAYGLVVVNDIRLSRDRQIYNNDGKSDQKSVNDD